MRPPNLVLINCDDLGYGDLGCYGSTVNRTPALDRMAAEGLRLTDFYQGAPVCTPSRGAMLTGCYPNRIGFGLFDGLPVLFPGQPYGLHPAERTLAALLKDLGYATKLIGKWHCGDQPEFLPTRHGFDSWFGLPYSNDMGRQCGDRKDWVRKLQEINGYSYLGRAAPGFDRDYPPLPLMENAAVLQEQPDQAALTERYVAEACRFLRAQQERPFFLYFAHMYVHLPIFTPDHFLQRSGNGRYGAAVEHVDWSVAALLAELQRLGLDRDTMVVFTSDNGSRLRGGGGSNGPLRGEKGSTFEGGQRVPCIVRWPGGVPGGRTSDVVCAGIDLLPTLVGLAGGTVPEDRPIDGCDLGRLWRGEAAACPDRTFFYCHCSDVAAVRQGPWKLHLSRNGKDCRELYHLAADVGESLDRSAGEPEVVARLSRLIEAKRQEIGDRSHAIVGTGCRPVGRTAAARTLTCYDPAHPYIMAEYDLTDAG